MDFSKFLMYSMVRGCTAVLTTVVSVRSYSPYSCPISAEIDTERSGYASRTISLARRSWEGFTYELRKPMASDSTPLSTSRFTASLTSSSSSSSSTSPPELIRSEMPTVSVGSAGRSGFWRAIQP